MIVTITLTVAGVDTGPFNLYSDVDGYVSAFETGVSKASLLAGYTSVLVPNGTTIVRVLSSGECTNFVDITISGECTTTTTTTTTINPCKSFSVTYVGAGSGGYSYTDCCTDSIVNLVIANGETVDNIHCNDTPVDTENFIVTNLILGYNCESTTTTTTTLAPQGLTVYLSSEIGNGDISDVEVYYSLQNPPFDPTQPEPLGYSWTLLNSGITAPECPTAPINAGTISIPMGQIAYIQVRDLGGVNIYNIGYSISNICVSGPTATLYTASFVYGSPTPADTYYMITNPPTTEPHESIT